MMGLDDFGLSVLASLLANKLEYLAQLLNGSAGKGGDDEARKDGEADSKHCRAIEFPGDMDSTPLRTIKFKTFDAWNDLSKLLAAVKDPVISVLIEDEPTTHYRLPSLVLESRSTGEWFVFSRGRMSFEGSGGGIRNSRDILDQVKLTGAAIGVWVLPQRLMSELDSGYETWANIKPHAIPLLARAAQDYSWAEIERNVFKQLQP